ncbi:nitrate- and nitrite sensing domain-containing protein [Actinomadura sp. LOL_016]|uniref:sensor histidine kinase n=1 Tax=unclassified Actinomadura TaxID=2626254 RepID=UPI003A807897
MPNPRDAGGTPPRRRTRPIRRRIALLLAIPLSALLVMWGVPATVTLTNALQRFDFSTVYNSVGVPATSAVEAVQQERSAAVRALVTGRDADEKRFRELADKTDDAVAAFRSSALSQETRDAMDPRVERRVEWNTGAFDGLGSLRSQVEIGGTTPLAAINGYSSVIDTVIRTLTTLVSVDDIAVYRNTNALLHNYWAREFMLREDTLLTALGAGRLDTVGRAAFASWAGTREQFFALGRSSADGEIATIMEGLADSGEYTAYTTLESGVVNNGIAPSRREWRAAIEKLDPVWLRSALQANGSLTREYVDPAGDRIMLGFYAVGGLGLLAVIASVTLSLLFARRLTDELRRLQETAQRLAHERLPAAVARLRKGEPVDVGTAAPPPATGGTTEIALVAEAFDAVQRTAIGEAIAEAELRAGINRVFINLSWRSQSLLHRQLRLLDQMERRASSPEELEDLFRLDHLTTRMRRHAEGLVILSGSPTVRAWDHPVPAEDVVRAAIAEVEDYTRVVVTGASSAAVIGNVVADVIHLLAELIENAAAFSPPATEVTVKVDTVANGLAVEVVDRGIGLSEQERDELNRRLASDVEFDLADTDRLGLFVVAKLAARHGVKVSLQRSAYGGTAAIVLVPHALVTVDDDLEPASAAEGRVLSATAAPARPSGRRSVTRLESLPRLGRRDRPELTGPPTPTYTPPAQPPAEPFAEPPADPSDPPPPSYRPAAPPFAAPTPAAAPDARPPAEPSVPAGPGADGGTGEAESSEVTGRLPKRVRQRNLAPQLRRPGAPSGGPADDDFPEPSPELSRDLMSSLQSGWLRGRDEGDDPGDLEPRDEWGRS